MLSGPNTRKCARSFARFVANPDLAEERNWLRPFRHTENAIEVLRDA